MASGDHLLPLRRRVELARIATYFARRTSCHRLLSDYRLNMPPPSVLDRRLGDA